MSAEGQRMHRSNQDGGRAGRCSLISVVTDKIRFYWMHAWEVASWLPLKSGVSRAQQHTAAASLNVTVCLSLIRRLVRTPLATDSRHSCIPMWPLTSICCHKQGSPSWKTTITPGSWRVKVKAMMEKESLSNLLHGCLIKHTHTFHSDLLIWCHFNSTKKVRVVLICITLR